MGNWLLQLALLALQRFRAVGGPHLRIAVNVSPVQFRQPHFVELVEEALRETQSQAADLEIEVTESVAGLLGRLKGMGITVAIDDFGTGYSSLSYLEKLPANRLKIDRTFVKALERNDNGTRIARTIIALGRELNLKIVAEGVENAHLAQVVKDLGCTEAQGYHYGKPMSEEAFLAWLAQHPAGLA
jgi:EAL domain-containing protein (putative c-di-GMP-specific phosphodiesterase class I)